MLCLLGSPAVALDAQPEPLRLRPKALALLAYLVLVGRAVPRQELARLLFPDAEGPRAALRWHLAHLRTAAPAPLARALRATRDTVALATPTDVAAFRAGAARLCDQPDVPDAPSLLSLYRGDLLDGLAVAAAADFDTWLYVEQEGLRRLLRRATLAFAAHAVANGRAAEATVPLARLVAVDPYCEDGHVRLIEAYEALGERDHAAAVYDRYQRTMRRDLKTEPRPAVARRFEPDPPVGPIAPLEALVPLREVTIHIVDWPGGEPPILAIHGSTVNAYHLAALAEQLAPDHRFVALDLRGHGFSDKPPGGYDLADHVEDTLQLIAALGLRRPVLLGHSAGGTIVTFVAGRTDVSGLILLEGMIGDRAFAENAAAMIAPVVATLDQRYTSVDAYLAESRANRPPLSDEAERLLDRWVRYDLAPLPDGTYRRRALRAAVEREWASIVDADSLGALARVRCPILIVQALQPWLAGRPYFTDAIIAAQRRVAPSAALFVARDTHHGALGRAPEPAMIEAIKRFIKGVAR